MTWDRRPYLLRCLDTLTQALNVWVLNGASDESTSGRAYRKRNERGWKHAYRLINSAFFWQDDHCRSAYLADLERARRRLRAARH